MKLIRPAVVLRCLRPTSLRSSAAIPSISHHIRTRTSSFSTPTNKRPGQDPDIKASELEINMEPKGPKSLKFIENALDLWLKPSLYAESWDNIGLLIGSGKYSKQDKMVSSILVCNDLTTAVTNEAVQLGTQLIVAYHPPIFNPMKRIGFSWKDSIISKCLANDISVYSPHTMLDSVPGGINDSIIHMLSSLCPSQDDFQIESIIPNKAPLAPTREMKIRTKSNELINESVVRLIQSLQSTLENNTSFSIDLLESKSKSEVGLSFFDNHNNPSRVSNAIREWAAGLGFQESTRDITPPGAGRTIKFKTAKALSDIQKALQTRMNIQHLKVANAGNQIYSVAVCAGSGGSLLMDVEADLIITGELSHHEVLNCFENGKSVILCGHANSERHYMPILADILGLLLNGPSIHVSKCDTNVLQWV